MNKNSGKLGEDIIENIYKSNNYTILSRNFRIKHGELDIIAFKDNILAVIEVKSRCTNTYGSPAEAVTKSKIKTIKFVTSYFLQKHKLTNINVRFDIGEVFFNLKEETYTTNIIKNAF